MSRPQDQPAEPESGEPLEGSGFEREIPDPTEPGELEEGEVHG